MTAQTGDPGSMLELYRRALRVRRAHPASTRPARSGEKTASPATVRPTAPSRSGSRAHPALAGGMLRWLPSPDGVQAVRREPRFTCVVNLSGDPVPAPAATGPLLASGPLTARAEVPADTAVWLDGR